MMRFIICLFYFIISLSSVHAGGGKPRVALRIHLQTDANLPSGKIVSVVLEKPPKTIAISPIPELSEQNVIGAENYSNMPGSVLLTFNRYGTKVLSVATSSNRGKHLVVFINGRVVYAPIIDTTLPNGKLLIPNNVTETELLELQKWAKRNQKNKI